MSSQKKPSIWQRFKKLLTAKQTSANPSTNDTPFATSSAAEKTVDTEQSTKSTSNLQSVKDKPANNLNYDRKATAVTRDSDTGSQAATAKKTSEKAGKWDAKQFVHSSNLDHTDKIRPSVTYDQNSDKPITDSILGFLEANDLNYYYHQPSSEAEKETGRANSGSSRKVHHISMSMRYYNDDDSNESSVEASATPNAELQPSVEQQSSTEQSIETGSMEWGCVIRVHEHTQLVAFYGVLPFHLPESHLQAGMVLATQLNYDMMLGCVEIDIRDGEVRFKNSVDFEPIINANSGTVPPQVLDYLLKGVMAMTASFAPLFSDLIGRDPQQFELDTLLDDLHKAQMDKTFFLPTQVMQ